MCLFYFFFVTIDWCNESPPQNKKNDNKGKSKMEKPVEFGTFTGNYKNDGISGEFDSMTYPHSQEMLKVHKIRIFLFMRI